LIDKVWSSAHRALADIRDGSVVLVGGFGDVGVPFQAIDALVAAGACDLTIVSNNCGTGDRGLALLFKHGLVRRVFASFPAQAGNEHFRREYEAGKVELELVPQGTLAERIRAGGAGIGAFYVRTGVGTTIAVGKETREFDQATYVLEKPLRGDVSLVKAALADRFGNLRFRRTARNFNPIMAMAAALTIVEAEHVVALGAIDPDDVHLPGIFVDRVFEAAQ
jgi:3-oxoadipate CoA-transferase, alpha subunit